jgi:hypothetical protein
MAELTPMNPTVISVVSSIALGLQLVQAARSSFVRVG